MRQCREGEHRVADGQALSAKRKGGGSYNRAPRWYSSTICVACARLVLEHVTHKHSLCGSARWDQLSVRHALSRWEDQEDQDENATPEFCHVAEQGCKAPCAHAAGNGVYTCRPDRDPTTRARCHHCGQAVCTNPKCSSRVKHFDGRKRVCTLCQANEVIR